MSSFNLTTASLQCFTEYRLVVRQEGVVRANSTFMASLFENNNVASSKTIVGNDVDIITCKYNYSFELTTVNGDVSSGEVQGNANLGGKPQLINGS